MLISCTLYNMDLYISYFHVYVCPHVRKPDAHEITYIRNLDKTMTNLVNMLTAGKTTFLHHRQTLLCRCQALLNPCNFLATYLQINHLPCIRSKCP